MGYIIYCTNGKQAGRIGTIKQRPHKLPYYVNCPNCGPQQRLREIFTVRPKPGLYKHCAVSHQKFTLQERLESLLEKQRNGHPQKECTES